MNHSYILALIIVQILSGLINTYLLTKGRLDTKYAYPLFFTFSLLALYIYAYLPNNHFGLYPLGITDYLSAVVFLIIGLTIVTILAKILKLKPINMKSYSRNQIILGVIVYTLGAFLQQYYYQVYLSSVTSYLFENPTIYFILFSSATFSIAHLSFKDKLFWQVSTFLGILMSIFYTFTPSYILISLIHSVAGLYGFYRGFITIDGKQKLNIGVL